MATVVTAKVSNRSAAMPAQSPTLSPTLSAIVAGLRGSSSGNTGFDLADHVAADVGALGEDAAAETGEDRDQRSAEAERHERVDDDAALRGVPDVELQARSSGTA